MTSDSFGKASRDVAFCIMRLWEKLYIYGLSPATAPIRLLRVKWCGHSVLRMGNIHIIPAAVRKKRSLRWQRLMLYDTHTNAVYPWWNFRFISTGFTTNYVMLRNNCYYFIYLFKTNVYHHFKYFWSKTYFYYLMITYRSAEFVALLAVSSTLFLFMHTQSLTSRLREMEVKLQPSEMSASGLSGNSIIQGICLLYMYSAGGLWVVRLLKVADVIRMWWWWWWFTRFAWVSFGAFPVDAASANIPQYRSFGDVVHLSMCAEFCMQWCSTQSRTRHQTVQRSNKLREIVILTRIYGRKES